MLSSFFFLSTARFPFSRSERHCAAVALATVQCLEAEIGPQVGVTFDDGE